MRHCPRNIAQVMNTSLATVERGRGSSFRSSVGFFIIFCLHYLSCTVENIVHVLQTYNLGGTPTEIALYIAEKRFLRYYEDAIPPDGQETFVRMTGTRLTVKTALGRPVRLEVSASCVSRFAPKRIVSVFNAGDIITVTIGDRLRICRL